jgi:peroxiredoxin
MVGLGGWARACALGLLVAGNALAAGKVGEMAYDFTGLKDPKGKVYNLKDFRGKVVLIFTVQYNCGGCRANAPRIGKMAKNFQGNSFQALGPDINEAKPDQLGQFEVVLRGEDSSLNFPLLSGLKKPNDIKDSLSGSANFGTLWTPYDALRDVYFVIDHTGKIVYRLNGNRGSAVATTSYTALENAIADAIKKVPTVSLSIGNPSRGLCLQACKQAGRYSFILGSNAVLANKNAALKILDSQGRAIRILNSIPNSSDKTQIQAQWDGKDFAGHSVAWGNYFINVTAGGKSESLLLSWLP